MTLTADEKTLNQYAMSDGIYNDNYNPEQPTPQPVPPAVYAKVAAMPDEAVRIKLRAYKDLALKSMNARMDNLRRLLTDCQSNLVLLQSMTITPAPSDNASAALADVRATVITPAPAEDKLAK